MPALRDIGMTGNEWADHGQGREPSEKKRDEARETPKCKSRGQNRPTLPRVRIRP